jgi:hypothetical protein
VGLGDVLEAGKAERDSLGGGSEVVVDEGGERLELLDQRLRGLWRAMDGQVSNRKN